MIRGKIPSPKKEVFLFYRGIEFLKNNTIFAFVKSCIVESEAAIHLIKR